jgi:hypothetical protein
MVLPNLETIPKRPAVDWELLQTAGLLFVSGFGLLLFGRGIRYVLANE